MHRAARVMSVKSPRTASIGIDCYGYSCTPLFRHRTRVSDSDLVSSGSGGCTDNEYESAAHGRGVRGACIQLLAGIERSEALGLGSECRVTASTDAARLHRRHAPVGIPVSRSTGLAGVNESVTTPMSWPSLQVRRSRI